jgi:hypothetical protein
MLSIEACRSPFGIQDIVRNSQERATGTASSLRQDFYADRRLRPLMR